MTAVRYWAGRFKALAVTIQKVRLRELAAYRRVRLEMKLSSDGKVSNRFSVLLLVFIGILWIMDDTEGMALVLSKGLR